MWWLFALFFVESSAKREYYGIAEKLDGYHAEEYCKNRFFSNLATITTPQENEDAFQECLRVDPSGECYIGLRRDSQFQAWYFTENNLPDYDRPGFTNWNSLCGVFSGLKNGRWDEEYCDEAVNTNAFLCNVNRNMPQERCDVQFDAWYQADSFDEASGTFADLSGNGLDSSYFSGSTYARVDDDLNGHSIVTAGVNDRIKFGPNLAAGENTIFHVAKYNGAAKARVFEGTDRSWISGFHAAKSGVCHEWGWITDHTDRYQSEWVISSTQPGLYRGNGVEYTNAAAKSHGPGDPYNKAIGQVTINVTPNSEVSDYAFAELIIIGGVSIDSNKLDCVEDYLSWKYGIDVASEYDPTASDAFPAVVFNNFNPGQGEVKGPRYHDMNYLYYTASSNWAYIFAALLVVNVFCVVGFCCFNRKDGKVRYKTVSFSSSTDADV